MSDSIETSGADVEAAVARALAELNVAREDVRIDILEEPGRRLLGLGGRPARVRVTLIKRPPPVSAALPSPPPAAPVTPIKPTPPPVVVPPPIKPPVQEAPAPPAAAAPRPPIPPPIAPIKPPPPMSTPPARPPVRHEHDDEDGESDEARASMTTEQLDQEAETGAAALRELLHHMQVNGEVIVKRAETDGHEAPHWMLEIQGHDLGGLIGYKGETLAALQYITRLIASRGMEHRANIVIDVEGYKSRRETMLRRLAKRMADQVMERGRPMSMEPMPPHERRIIHLALRDHPSVKTESVGEGERRKVTIVPRRNR